MTSDDIFWTDSLEKLFKKSAEQFLCLRWSHDHAQRYCSSRNTFLTIPVIILSGLAGLGSVGTDNLLPFGGAGVLVGFVSFTAGTLQTIASYFAFAKRSEAHRVAALSYERLHRMIEFELKVDREHRTQPSQLIQKLKDEADRLGEISPQLPTHTILEFKKRFADETLVSVPAILNGLEQTEIAVSSPAPTPRPLVRVQI